VRRTRQPGGAGAVPHHRGTRRLTDGQWSNTDRLGYDEVATIARNYRYITGPQDAIRKFKGDAATWAAANQSKESDYPGVLIMPADITVLARFDVPAGVYPGAQPCT
jgi:hypothetical protein